MFTGIISDIGTIRSVDQRGDRRIEVACSYDVNSVALGASIACSGACLTVVDKGADWFAADLSAETVARTASGLWERGNRLNLERALKVGDELGGHIVTGHVDGVGTVEAVEPVGDSTRITIGIGEALAPYVAAKGSIALDGVSLTVNDVMDAPTRFTINLIPHSAAMTTLGAAAPGRELNIEIDVLARYLARMQAVLAR